MAQVWGWATWSDRWKASEKNVFYLREAAKQTRTDWCLSKSATRKKFQHINGLVQGLDAWDYQWQVSILNADGLAVTASSNLISNLGDGPDATHTKNDSSRVRLPVAGLQSYKYLDVNNNKGLTDWYESKIGLRGGAKFIIKWAISYSQNPARRLIKNLINKLLYINRRPIVIASTGRSGSTMLTRAIAYSLVDSRFGWLPSSIRRYIRHFSTDYISRIFEIDDAIAPVIKTHEA